MRNGEWVRFVIRFEVLDTAKLAQKTIALLGAPDRFAAMRRKASASIRKSYYFETRSLPKFMDLIRHLAPEVAAAPRPVAAPSRGLFASPWFWTAAGLVLLGGVAATAIVLGTQAPSGTLTPGAIDL